MLGDKVKTLRKQLKITQQKLAKSIGVSQSTIGMIEGNKQGASNDTLIKLANVLNTTVDYLLSESNDKDNKSNSAQQKTIKDDFPIIPEEFTDPQEARSYVMKHQIFAYGGFYPDKMSDEDILNFANEMIEQAKLIKYKYESKNRNK